MINLVKTKKTAKRITSVTVGALYFPIYLLFWVLRIVSRFVLAISHFGTFNSRQGSAIMKSIFQKDYERNF